MNHNDFELQIYWDDLKLDKISDILKICPKFDKSPAEDNSYQYVKIHNNSYMLWIS